MSRDVQKIDIVFTDPGATFKAGEQVSGKVQMELVMELKLKGIKLVLLGVARVHWDEKRAYTKGSSAKLSHRNMDSYLEETYTIMSKGDTLQPGRYVWPFNFRLPLYLPSTYDGQWGRVHYAAKLVLERPWKGDIEFVRNFSVLGLFDLNTDPDAKTSADNFVESEVGSGCFKSGPVQGHLAVTRRGFAIGQDVSFRARVNNKSKKKLNVRIVLSQLATFRADKQTRKSLSVIKVMVKGEVKAGEELLWDDDLKAIPTVPPTHLGGGCRTIDVKYSLTLVVSRSNSSNDVEVPVEIIIGTVPLRSISERRALSSSSSSQSQGQAQGQGQSQGKGQQSDVEGRQISEDSRPRKSQSSIK